MFPLLMLGAALAQTAAPAAAEPEAPAAATPAPAITIKPGLLVDLRAFVADHKAAGLQAQRVRPAARGELLDGKVAYVFQGEFAGEAPSLLDAVIAWRPGGGVSLQAGRFLVPYTRAQITPVPKLQFHGFAPSENVERHGRDYGVQAAVHRGPVDARVGVFQGGAATPGGHPLVLGRAAVDVIGEVPLDEGDVAVRPDGDNGLSIGFSARYGGDVRGVDEVLDSTGAAVDVATRLGPTRFQAEGFYRVWEDGATQTGGYVQGSVSPMPKVEFGSRVDVWHVDVDTWTLQGLATYYAHGHHARISLQAQTAWVGDADPTWSVAIQPQVWI